MGRLVAYCSFIWVVTTTATVSPAAQTAGATEIGIKGGINLAEFSGSDSYGWDARLGPTFGGFFTFKLGSHIALQPELLYTSKGAKLWEAEERIILSYLELTLLVRIRLPEMEMLLLKRVRPRFLFGPAIAFKLSAERDLGGTVELENIRDTDFSIVAGGGFDLLRFGRSRVIFNIRVGFGVRRNTYDVVDVRSVRWSSIENAYAAHSSGRGFDWKNRLVSLLLGVAF